MITNLTTGKPEGVLWRFSIPLFTSAIFQQLYNMADSVIAGKFAGEAALAAVGVSYPITMIFMAIAFGSNIGCSVVISRLFGAKRLGDMKTAVSTTLLTSLVLALLLSLVGLLITPQLMQLVNTPADIFEDGALYLRIFLYGLVFVFLYNAATGIFTSLGDSKTPLYFLIGSSLGNIFLDWLFVAVFRMGVAGVGWATFIAQGAACILALVTLLRRLYRLSADDCHTAFSLPMLGQISKVAVPSILQQSFISVGNFFIQYLVNGYGSSVIAGYSAAIKLNVFAITCFVTLGNGISSFTAQNMGAVQYERVRRGFFAGCKMAVMVAIPFMLVYFLAGDGLVRLFMKEQSALAVETGRYFLRIVTPFYFFVAIKLTADGVLRGAGWMGLFMVSTFTDLILRVVLAFALTPVFQASGIWMSWPLGWMVSSLLSVVFYRLKTKALPQKDRS